MEDKTVRGETISEKRPHNQTMYKPEYCDVVKKHMEMGYSFETLVGVIGVSSKTLYKWVDQFPEFKEAKEIAFSKAQDFFEKRLMAKISGQDLSSIGITTKNIDTSCLIFALKTRFHKAYGDKSKIEHDVTEDVKKLVINMGD